MDDDDDMVMVMMLMMVMVIVILMVVMVIIRRKRTWVLMIIIWKEKRSKWNWLNLGIMDARNVASGFLPHTHHYHQSWQIHFWWTIVGGNFLVEFV